MLLLEAVGCSCCVADGRKVPGHGCALYRVMFQDILSDHGFFLSVDRCKNEVADHQCPRISGVLLLGVETPICSNWA